MSLKKITFNTPKSSQKKISQKLELISKIKKTILVETAINVKITKLHPPLLIIQVDNSPAASELRLQKDIILKKLQEYQIDTIQIRIQ